MSTTQIEKENLEVHVDMCAMRYSALEGRLTKVETKLDDISDLLQKSQHATLKLIFSSTATIVAAAISVIIALVMKGL